MGLPIMPPSLRAKPLGLFLSCFIIFCIISNCLSSLLTSATVVPLPAALLRYQRSLKHQLDPQGIFNPGRLYAEL